MHPIDIPNDGIIQGFERVFLGAPEGQEDLVAGTQALFNHEPPAPPMYAMLIKVDDEDLAKIRATGGFWFIQLTNSAVPVSFQHLEDLPTQPHLNS